MADREPLTDAERAVYEWQLWVPDFGEAGQQRLKGAAVLVSRVGVCAPRPVNRIQRNPLMLAAPVISAARAESERNSRPS